MGISRAQNSICVFLNYLVYALVSDLLLGILTESLLITLCIQFLALQEVQAATQTQSSAHFTEAETLLLVEST